MQQPFVGLYATYYDVLFPLDTIELHFYRHFLQRNPGSALEIGCGTGNLLLSYRMSGFDVHGLDCSPAMLATVALKAKQAGFAVSLYHQVIEELNLFYKFQTIYIPSCTFMFITDPEQAVQTLKRLYDHLLPGGQLLISSFLPYQEMMSSQFERHCIRDVAVDENTQLTVHQTVDYDYVHQVRTCVLDFELWHAGVLQKYEQHTFLYRWYAVDELSTMLRAAGFSDVTLYGDYQLQLIAADAETFIVCATKNY